MGPKQLLSREINSLWVAVSYKLRTIKWRKPSKRLDIKIMLKICRLLLELDSYLEQGLPKTRNKKTKLVPETLLEEFFVEEEQIQGGKQP
ncbi:MAG: hypothetical protein QXS29_10065 [Nitrososphaeria archaeon]